MEVPKLNLPIPRLKTFGDLSNFEYVSVFRDGRAVTVTSSFGLKIECLSVFSQSLAWHLGTE